MLRVVIGCFVVGLEKVIVLMRLWVGAWDRGLSGQMIATG